ncbi:hypothetical protein [Hydrogenophaga sp. MI9]|uniref:hypothetical protein n=1 Tax=Hydrogenophaga sp. MI9 TaxID=3453719 RepID=UPI003EEB0EC8
MGAAIATKALTSTDAQQLRAALSQDASDALYSGILTIGEAAQGLDRRLFTWATVKLYYSVFYLTRAMLEFGGASLIYVGRTPYLWKAVVGERPEKRSGNTHAVVLEAFEQLVPGSLLLSQTIGADTPFAWLMARREAANYKVARFSEPSAPAHFRNIERFGVRRLLGDYIGDNLHMFAFDPDHAMLAYPIETMKLALGMLKTAVNSADAAALAAEDVTYLASQCFDRNGRIAEFQRLIAA